MALSATRGPESPRMSAQDFRAFQSDRPDEERWELIDGLPVMMTPPFIDHNRIASNFERLLNDALSEQDPTRVAVQRPGVELGLDADVLAGLGQAAGYRPEPDVAVFDDDPQPERRFVDRALLTAEVVSDTDDLPVTAGGETWIDAKCRLYRAHEHCEAVVVIRQQVVEVRVLSRAGAGWVANTLRDGGDDLILAAFGLRCVVDDLYAGTHLRPRPIHRHEP